ncbi:MAG: thiosulfate oxidation carrier protein SoxY [Magnetococcales bacterium]|nr:thiosulfate oxidation carrier protein SoxY [Magnetococcales bacterium]
MTRRGFFCTAGAAGLSAAVLVGIPGQARATGIPELIAETMGPGEPANERVIVDAPPKAENGSTVRIPVKVDHPMEADNYIAAVAIFVENNPNPLTARFEFLPAIGAVEFEVRIKMAKASPVRVVAKTNSGKLYQVIKQIEVAEGGCAG